jgi:hypothetical protein
VAEAQTPEVPTPGDDEILDRIAAEVVRRGMVTPAVFFLELNRPLSFLAGQTAHVLFPFLAPLLGIGFAREIAELLEDPSNVDRLLDRIERLEQKEAA